MKEEELKRFYHRQARADYKNLWDRTIASLSKEEQTSLLPFRYSYGKLLNDTANRIEAKYTKLQPELHKAVQNDASELMKRWLQDELLRRVAKTEMAANACPIDAPLCTSELRKLVLKYNGRNRDLQVLYSLASNQPGCS